MTLDQSCEFARLMAAWTVRQLLSEQLRRTYGDVVEADRLQALDEGSPISVFRGIAEAVKRRGLRARAKEMPDVRAIDMASSIEYYACRVVQLADNALDARTSGEICDSERAVEIANWISAATWAGTEAVRAFAAAYPGVPMDFGACLLRAYALVGGVVELVRSPGVTRRLIEKVDADSSSLDMDTFHNLCGTAHCIAGWYAYLAGAHSVERAIGPRATAYLVFAAEHPGESLPYTGTDMACGREEIERLRGLVTNKGDNT